MPNVKSSAEIHSVILNLNKNFSNNQGSNFKQIVNKQLELKPNTLVALYSGNIVRKPIVIEDNTVLDLQFPSQFPTDAQKLLPSTTTHVDDIDVKQPQAVTTIVPKGFYSKISFGRVICELANALLESPAHQDIETVIAPSATNEMTINTPYRLFFEVKDNNVWLGLRRVEMDYIGSQDNEGPYRVPLEDMDDGQNNTSNITLAVDNERLIFQSTLRTANYDAFALGNTPILPHCYSHLSDPETNPVDVGWANLNINIDPVAASTELLEFCYVFNNTYFTSQWNPSAAPTPPTQTRLVDVNNKPFVVSGLLGAYFAVQITNGDVTTQSMTLYANSVIDQVPESVFGGVATDVDFVMNAGMRSLATINLSDYDFSDVLSGIWCEVYAVDVPTLAADDMPNGIVEDHYEYYFRWYMRSPYSNVDELTLLFDSKNVGLRIQNHLVDSGYLFQCIPSEGKINSKYQSGGLCPQFYFKNCLTDLKVSQPSLNSCVGYNSLEDVFQYKTGIRSYNFQPTTDENSQGVPIVGGNTKNNASLQNVLGVADNETRGTATVNEETLFNPSKYPSNKSMAGLTKLSSDDQRYNIEVNLPVKAYNTTEQTTNDIGQTRTIIYNTNASLGTDDNPSVGLINKELQPSNLKYLSLNNPNPIKLNTLDINIRRAKTNAIAEEITDSSLELIFYSEGQDTSGPY